MTLAKCSSLYTSCEVLTIEFGNHESGLRGKSNLIGDHFPSPPSQQILPLEIMKETKRQLEKSKLVVASNVYRNLSLFFFFLFGYITMN
jgi:hypothetical protein